MNEISAPPEAEPTTALTVATGNPLAVVMRAVSTVLAADKNDILGQLKAELDGFDGDVTTEKGRKLIASKAYKVATAKQDLIRLADTLKTDAQKTIKATNAEVKVIEEQMNALRDRVREPLDVFENAEKARVAGHEAALAELLAMGNVTGLPSDAIKARIWSVPPVESRDWQEFLSRAEATTTDILFRLRNAHAEAAQVEAQAAELARFKALEAARIAEENERKRVEREAQIAADARAQAEIEAEAKVKAAEARADQARRDGERAEIEARERAEQAIVAERNRVAEAAAERQRQDAARAADLDHRTKVNRSALADIIIALSPAIPPDRVDAAAKLVVTAIAKGAVRAVSIQY